MKRIYTPPLFLGLFRLAEPVEVEVIAVDYQRRLATVIMPIAENAVINIIRKQDGSAPLQAIEKQVPLSFLKKPGLTR